MSFKAQPPLPEASVKQLQELIRANIDSFDGLQDAALAISDHRIAKLFHQIADERSSVASELQEWVEWNGEEAAKEGSLTASVHRAWINVRSKLSGGDAYAVLDEAERGEDYIKNAYEAVLQETAGTPLHDLLLSQYATVKEGHDKIRDLRDAYQPH